MEYRSNMTDRGSVALGFVSFFLANSFNYLSKWVAHSKLFMPLTLRSQSTVLPLHIPIVTRRIAWYLSHRHGNGSSPCSSCRLPLQLYRTYLTSSRDLPAFAFWCLVTSIILNTCTPRNILVSLYKLYRVKIKSKTNLFVRTDSQIHHFVKHFFWLLRHGVDDVHKWHAVTGGMLEYMSDQVAPHFGLVDAERASQR